MDEKTNEALSLIVEKSYKLKSFEFEKHVISKGPGFGFKFQQMEDGWWNFDFHGIPDEKERDAFLLTFRLFHQKNEGISFPNITNLVKLPDLSTEWIDEALRIHDEYHSFLDSHSVYTVNLFDGQPNRRKMLEVGLYGGLAHANRQRLITQFKEWTKDDIRAALFQQEFTKVLLYALVLIYRLGEISQAELDK